MSILERLPKSDRRSALIQQIKAEAFSTNITDNPQKNLQLVVDEHVSEQASLGPESKELLYNLLDSAMDSIRSSSKDESYSLMQRLIKVLNVGYGAHNDRELSRKIENFCIDEIKKHGVKSNLIASLLNNVIDAHFNIDGFNKTQKANNFLMRTIRLIESIYSFDAEDEWLQKKIFDFYFKMA